MRFETMKTKLYFTQVVLILFLAFTGFVSAQEGTITPSGSSPITASFEIHHEPIDESFVIYSDEISLGGLLPTKVDYEKDYTKLQGKTFDIQEKQSHGGIEYNSYIDVDGVEKNVTGGTITVSEVTPMEVEGHAQAKLKGTFQVALADGSSAEGDFQLTAFVRDYSLNTLGMLLMVLSIASVWLLAIFCYKKLLFDS
jgi:hypothetical protein